MPADHYATLEVNPRACVGVIEAAAVALLNVESDESRREAISQALEVLKDPARRAAFDAERAEDVGTIIGPYRMIAKIATGGFGPTYKAEHLLTGMPVCIKTCSEIDPGMDEILLQEARAVWDLRHYAIPTMRDMIRLDTGALALVMSFVEGPTLEQIVEQTGRVDAEHVAWIMERMLNALKYLHYNGVVHGDIKPQNIIVQPERHMAVLVDFGLAMVKPRASDENVGYTKVYSPEEQRAGKPLLPETDLYSLGMTALYALNGGGRATAQKRFSPHVGSPDADLGPLRRLIQSFIIGDVLERPNWQKIDLCEEISKVREITFGRRRSAMKPLTLPNSA